MFGGLEGGFCKDTYEAKLFGVPQWKVFFSVDKSWFPTVSEIYNPEPVSWVENE